MAGPVNNAACPSVICWLSAVTLKCPVPIWPELSCCLWDYQRACPLSTWKLGMGTWPSCFSLSGSSECLLALLCLVSLAVNSTQSGVGCFWERSTWLLGMGKEKEWNQNCQLCLQGSEIFFWRRVASWILESTPLWLGIVAGPWLQSWGPWVFVYCAWSLCKYLSSIHIHSRAHMHTQVCVYDIWAAGEN